MCRVFVTWCARGTPAFWRRSRRRRGWAQAIASLLDNPARARCARCRRERGRAAAIFMGGRLAAISEVAGCLIQFTGTTAGGTMTDSRFSQRLAVISTIVIIVGIGVCRTMRADSTAQKPATKVETLADSRGGQDLVGTRFPELHFDRWLRTDDNRPLDTAGSVTLYRWWTDTCPYCAATLPAIEILRAKYQSLGLKVVGVYHTKPPRNVKDEPRSGAADRIGWRRPHCDRRRLGATSQGVALAQPSRRHQCVISGRSRGSDSVRASRGGVFPFG